MSLSKRALAFSILTASSLLLVTPAQAVKVCFDYALFRAAQQQGVATCDPAPDKAAAYLDAPTLQTRLTLLGYERVSGDPASFGPDIFANPGKMAGLARPGDVIFLRTNHVGFVVNGPANPAFPGDAAGLHVDHFLQLPGRGNQGGEVVFDTGALPPPTKGTVFLNGADTEIWGGFFSNDPLETFLRDRPYQKGGAMEVWRVKRSLSDAEREAFRKTACPPRTTVASGTTLWKGRVPNDRPDRMTTPATQVGVTYVITASGQFSDWADGDPRKKEPDGVDAVWCYAKWRCGDKGEAWQQLRIDGKGMSDIAGTALPYDGSHTYRVDYVGTGKPIEFFLADAQGSSSDNSGGVDVTVTTK